MTFAELLSRHAGAAFWRQTQLAELVGSASWGMDLGEGRITIGEHAFPVQLLGSEAEGDRSWLWAWANAASNFPPALLRFAEGLRERGERDGVDELSERSFPIERASGHQIGLLASGLAGDAHAYYRAPYDGGALYVLMQEVPVVGVAEMPAVRVPGLLSQAISAFDLDHRALAMGLLEDAGFSPADRDDVVSGRRGKDVMTVTFDGQGRISGIKGSLAPGASSRKEGLGTRLKGLFGR